jgi:hypothetical protein
MLYLSILTIVTDRYLSLKTNTTLDEIFISNRILRIRWNVGQI